jgi:hypothetical protein
VWTSTSNGLTWIRAALKRLIERAEEFSSDGYTRCWSRRSGRFHALFLLEQGADPNGDAGLTFHWASGEWENGTANPVYELKIHPPGFRSSGQAETGESSPEHHADPNARMTRAQPAFSGGYTDAVGATPCYLPARLTISK